LSMKTAHRTFYCIHKHSEPSDPINDILEKLDFHPLSITLLATVAQYNKRDADRLTREWEQQRTEVLHAQHSGSLATTIELSLASPMFRELGPDVRGLLGVAAFFLQGIDEKNIDWLFPAVSHGPTMFDTFCTLSLTYRSNGFATMLAPLRDYLRPKDPTSSPLLGATKDCYSSRLSAGLDSERPGFEELQWIASEDVNVEHLLDVFASIDANSTNTWNACTNFMDHLYWHKPRLIVLGLKIEALPDDHPSKAHCLQASARLFYSVGNWVERKRLLTHALKLWREQRDDQRVALALGYLADTNRLLGLGKEAMQQVREALEIYERLGDTGRQAWCSIALAALLFKFQRLDDAEEATSSGVGLVPEGGGKFIVCQGRHILGEVYHSKGNREGPARNFEAASKLHLLSTWSISRFRFISPWRRCFLREAILTTRKLTLTVPSRTRSTRDTIRLVHRRYRLWFGVDNIGLKR